jgi:hypothetical protein
VVGSVSDVTSLETERERERQLNTHRGMVNQSNSTGVLVAASGWCCVRCVCVCMTLEIVGGIPHMV